MRIDTDVPYPLFAGNGRPTKLAIPFGDMLPGNSVLVTREHCQSKNLESLVKTHTSRARMKYPTWEFATRKEGDGFRVWRLK